MRVAPPRSLYVEFGPLLQLVSRETLTAPSYNAYKCFTYNSVVERIPRSGAHGLADSGHVMSDSDTSQHHGQTHVLEVSIGIIRKGAVGSVILLRDRALQGRR